MRAIVFDFFGTLTDPSAEAERRPAMAVTAEALGVPPDAFWNAMSASFGERIVGTVGDTPATLREMARRCGAQPSDETLAAALRVYRAGAERTRRPRARVWETLDELRARGFRLAVLSDCGSELCDAWPGTPYASRLDAAVFSWQEGYRKPDPRLYATAARRLGVPVSGCWFVGDGGSREHQGALAAGMRPVLITNAGHPGAAAYRDDPDSHVPDVSVDDIDEVPAVVGHPEPESVRA
jgi:putative hydrolase of the HAD superfamily